MNDFSIKLHFLRILKSTIYSLINSFYYVLWGSQDGAVSLKLPNFLTTSQDVTKGADQANWATATVDNRVVGNKSENALTDKSSKHRF